MAELPSKKQFADKQLEACFLTPAGFITGTLDYTNVITNIHGDTPQANVPAEADRIVLPGFIDVHVHGGGGGDTMDGPEGVRKLAQFHVRHGTTTLYPTTMTNPWEAILSALEGVRTVQAEADPNLPDIAGVHLEGPFISPNRLGAQPPFTLTPTVELLEQLLAYNVIRLVTLAPEIDNAQLAAQAFAEADVRVSFGHTVCTAEDARTCAEVVSAAGGTVSFTHLYNAMSPLQSRAPGAVGAALADERAFAELIFDTNHVHPTSMLAAFHAKLERLMFITDSIRASGLDDGKSELGGQTVTVEDGRATLADGTLAGSILTLDKALRNGLEAGLNLRQASQLLSTTPARYMGLADRGELVMGKRADMVVVSREFEVLEVIASGRSVHTA
ncbi:MAG: N-acetylglucosamine-6-phosphate deacetylase [Deinococcota bacterium]